MSIESKYFTRNTMEMTLTSYFQTHELILAIGTSNSNTSGESIFNLTAFILSLPFSPRLELMIFVNKNAVDEIGKRIRLIYQTYFERAFEVTTKMDASNMAYASGDESPYHIYLLSLTQSPEVSLIRV